MSMAVFVTILREQSFKYMYSNVNRCNKRKKQEGPKTGQAYTQRELNLKNAYV